jgi:hypothetical protein
MNPLPSIVTATVAPIVPWFGVTELTVTTGGVSTSLPASQEAPRSSASSAASIFSRTVRRSSPSRRAVS